MLQPKGTGRSSVIRPRCTVVMVIGRSVVVMVVAAAAAVAAAVRGLKHLAVALATEC